MAYSKEEYENEPVHYCESCLSLNIKELQDVQLDICGECGNTDVNTTDMYSWSRLYTAQYGNAFLEEPDAICEDCDDDYDYQEMI